MCHPSWILEVGARPLLFDCTLSLLDSVPYPLTPGYGMVLPTFWVTQLILSGNTLTDTPREEVRHYVMKDDVHKL
ncbi:hypothetical protein STEG23_020184 [Scotinomys teguina]